MAITYEKLAEVKDFESLAALMHHELGWQPAQWKRFKYVKSTYGLPNDLPSVEAVMNFEDDRWGVFLVDFGDDEMKRSKLRLMLNAFAERTRPKDAERHWKHENILFIVRHSGNAFSFSRYIGSTVEEAKLRSFGWTDPLEARTAVENLNKLQWGEDWSTAWDVEKLTRDFFTKLSDLFYDTLDVIAQQVPDDREPRLFVQTLFNRLLFLRFVEKRGWLRLPERPDYLRALWELGRDSTTPFWPTRLNALFEAVNHPTTDRVHEIARPLIGDVEYLNGGLFDDDPRFVDPRIRVPASVFDKLLGPEGLFYKYNFTVEESSPENVIVAVDPEILGKIFEQLTISQRRHDTGSYYTPREVVQFMCREALVTYLAAKGLVEEKARTLVYDPLTSDLSNVEGNIAFHALRDIKVIDPACGSGAYLVGMLQELYSLFEFLERHDRRFSDDPAREDHQRKLWIIENSIYGVDLQAFATNTAMLRLWLTLLVEDAGKRPQPLPNLEYKIEAGNSLLGPDPREPINWQKGTKSGQALLYDQSIHITVDALRLLRSQYQDAHGTTKARIKGDLEAKLAELRAKVTGNAEKDVNRFDWRVEFFDVFLQDPQDRKPGFDAVLANPPYVRYQLLTSIRPSLQRLFPEVYAGAADLLVYFLGRSCQLVREGGSVVFITSNQWLRKEYGERLSANLARTMHVRTIVDFGDLPVFDNTDAYAAVFVFQKSLPGTTVYVQVPDLDRPYPNVSAVVSLYGRVLPNEALLFKRWFLGRELAFAEFEQMVASGRSLGSILDENKSTIRSGVKTGANDLYYVAPAIGKQLARAAGPHSVVPALQTGEVARWHVHEADTYIILAPSGQAAQTVITDHLRPHQKRLASRSARGKEWYQLRACTFYDEFSRPYIAFPDIAIGPRFALVDQHRVADYTVQFIPSCDLFLLAVLNSRSAYRFVLEMSGRQRGGYVRFQENVLRLLPIPNVADLDRSAIVRLVELILTEVKNQPDADLSEWEVELDKRIDFLYFHQGKAANYDEWVANLEAEKGTKIEDTRNLIAGGENHTVEFKASILWDLGQDKQSNVMRDEVLKEICAFLNADGGTILCGVHDDKRILGLQKDLKFKAGEDALGRALTDTFGDLLRPHPVELAKPYFMELDGQTILRIDVQPDRANRYESPSTKPADAGKNLPRTHVRVHASAKALEGQDLINWWERRRKGPAERVEPVMQHETAAAGPRLLKAKELLGLDRSVPTRRPGMDDPIIIRLLKSETPDRGRMLLMSTWYYTGNFILTRLEGDYNGEIIIELQPEDYDLLKAANEVAEFEKQLLDLFEEQRWEYIAAMAEQHPHEPADGHRITAVHIVPGP